MVGVTLPREAFPSAFFTGMVIWRPMHAGKLVDVRVFPPRGTFKHSHVKTIPLSPDQDISEPSVNWYAGDGPVSGITTFIQSADRTPIHSLPENWYGLQVNGVPNNLRSVFASPLTCSDLAEYVAFRNALAEVYQSALESRRVQFLPGLRRLHFTPTAYDSVSNRVTELSATRI